MSTPTPSGLHIYRNVIARLRRPHTQRMTLQSGSQPLIADRTSAHNWPAVRARLTRLLIVALLIVPQLVLTQTAWAQSPGGRSADVRDVFAPIESSQAHAQRSATRPSSRAVRQQRLVSVSVIALREAVDDFAAQQQGQFFVPLFNGDPVVATITTAKRGVHGYLQLSGTIDAGDNSHFHLVVTDDGVVAGSISVDNTIMRVGYAGAGRHTLQQLDPSQFLPELPPRADTTTGAVARQPNALAAARDDGELVDVLVVYTEQAAASKGGAVALQAEIDVAMLEANQVLLQSGVRQVLRLVGSRQVNYTVTGDMNESLSDLTYPTYFGSGLQSVHAFRDQLGADIVMMVTGDNNYCGLAWVMRNLSVTFAGEAFGIINQDCLTGSYVLVHELGHIMGLAHNRAVQDTVGITDYAYGYTAPSGDFRTIMAYQTCASGPCTLVNYFSSPLLSTQGQSLGVAAPSPDAADSVRALNETTPVVAQFRPTKLITNPAITYPGSATSLPESDAGFIWAANGRQVDAWQLWLGNRPGANELFDSGEITTNTARVAQLPTDGRIVYATLRFKQDGEWRSSPSVYYANNNGVPQMTSPLPDAQLTGTSQRFAWNNGGLSESTWRVKLLDASNTVISEQTLSFLNTSILLSGWRSNGQEITFELSYDTPTGSKTQKYTYKTPASDATPGLKLTKVVAPAQFNAGDSLTYTFTVSNTGTIPLSSVIVTDEKLGGRMCNVRTLPVGAAQVCREALYTPTAQEIASKRVSNTATATATQITTAVSDSAIATLVDGSGNDSGPDSDIDLSVTVQPAQFSRVGERLTYTFTIANNSDIPLNAVTISDSLSDEAVCQIGSLWMGISTTCTTSYTVTSDDLTQQAISTSWALQASETNAPVEIKNDVSYAFVTSPDSLLTLTSTATTGQSINLNDVITVDIDVKNDTDVTHTNIRVSDARLGGTVCNIESLSPSFSARCTATHIINASDISAGVFSSDSHVSSDQNGDPQTTSTSVNIDQSAGLSAFNVEASSTRFSTAGETIILTYRLTSNPIAPLTNIEIKDSLTSNTICSSESLWPPHQLECTLRYITTIEDVQAGRIQSSATLVHDDTDVAMRASVLIETLQ